MNSGPDSIMERIRRYMVGLRMPRALETLDTTLQHFEQGGSSMLDVCKNPFLEVKRGRPDPFDIANVVVILTAQVARLFCFDFPMVLFFFPDFFQSTQLVFGPKHPFLR